MLQLLRAEREREEDFGIAKRFFNAVIARSVGHLDLRKICSQFFRKPCGHIPQIKVVMNDDQKFHFASTEYLVASTEIPPPLAFARSE